MVDAAKPSDALPGPGTSADELQRTWDRFRSGQVVPCPADGAPLALAVDASVGTYRLVCTRCGVASPWFESGPDGVRIRSLGQAGATQVDD